MLKAKDLMSTDVITVKPETEILQAARLLLDRRINGVPVVDDKNRLVGILCQSDLIIQQRDLPMPSVFTVLDGLIPMSSLKSVENQVKKIAATTVAQAMTPNPITVTPESGIEEIAKLMVDKKLHTLPVVKGDKLVGVVGKEDVLKTLLPGDVDQ